MSIRRFNLICHGMMAFWQEDDSTLSILIPDEGPYHSYKVGCVLDPGQTVPNPTKLRDLPAGDLRLEPLKAGSLKNDSLEEGLGIPILDGGTLRQTGRQRNKINVPMPDEIRSYCASEVRNFDVAGRTPSQMIRRIPAVVSDVVVLSWSDTTASNFFLRHSDGRVLSATVVLNDQVIDKICANLGIYAQPGTLTIPHPPNHGASWNEMMVARDGKGVHPDLKLALHGIVPDGPPVRTSIDISISELQALVDFTPGVTDRTGCGSAAVVRSGAGSYR